MRILWFTNTSSNYGVKGSAYNGGGWISSLESEISKREGIELAVSFFLDGQPEKVKGESGVVYYPMSNIESKGMKVCRLLFPRNEERERKEWMRYEERLTRVVKDFKPDIIQVFGSERQYGLIANVIKVPVVLHLQGILTPCLNAYLPPFVSWKDFIFCSYSPLNILRKIKEKKTWQLSVEREKEIMRRVNYYIGRTDWDRRVTKVYNSKSRYFYGSEVLRPVFYEEAQREMPHSLTIVTTISSPLYKGFDVVLKTAQLLKDVMGMNFEWKCFGNINPKIVERRTGLRHEDENIKLMGVASAQRLKEEMLRSTLYVHSSYIDNSPNSLCEAQILGLPTVATNVGGVSSLIKDKETGFLVPANDPYQLAYLIRYLYEDKKENLRMGQAAKDVALKRHDRKQILDDLIETYKQVIEDDRKIKQESI